MASVGVNGAAAASLNERFIKCPGCKVNVPKEDMIALGKCTVCGRAYEPEGSGEVVVVETVAFAGDGANAASFGEAAGSSTGKTKRKRWMELKSKRGRTYYHNVDTGEDSWERPIDIDAEAVGNDGFVPFKNDAVKNAVLREQAKMDATKMGLPAEVIATLQQQQLKEQEEEVAQDPLRMLKRSKNATAAAAAAPSSKPTGSPKAAARRLDQIPDVENDDDDDGQDDGQDESSHDIDSPSTNSQAKQGSCVVM